MRRDLCLLEKLGLQFLIVSLIETHSERLLQAEKL